MTNSFDWIRGGFRFDGHPWLRVIALVLFLFVALLSSYAAVKHDYLPFSAYLAIAVSACLIVILCFDSLAYLATLLVSSTARSLPILRHLDIELERSISRVEMTLTLTVADKQLEFAKTAANELRSEFENRPAFPIVVRPLLLRILSNFFFTILCFTILSVGLVALDRSSFPANPTYNHDCLATNDFASVLAHLFYYHSAVFQSLGDDNHIPQRLPAQLVTVTEVYITFFYMVFIFGALLSTTAYVHASMTPARLTSELHSRLKDLCSHNHPTRRDGAS